MKEVAHNSHYFISCSDEIKLNISCFTARDISDLLHGDGGGYECLRHSEGSGADITTGTVTQVPPPHMKLINQFNTSSGRTH